MVRGANRGSESTLRWAVIGGIVVVVVIATILAIIGALSGGKTASPPAPTYPSTSACLFPSTVHVASTVATPRHVSPASNPGAKHGLIRAEKLLRKHSLQMIAVSRSGRHFLYLNRNLKIVLGTAGGRSRVLPVKAQDVTFNRGGAKIIYQKSSLKAHACATLVLEKMGLSGKHRKLLLASSAFRLANTSGLATEGTLQQDELSNGEIILVYAHQLYAFNPANHTIARLESRSLGTLYRLRASGSAPPPAPQFLVAPSGSFAVEGNLGAPAVYSLPDWKVQPATISGSVSGLAWSYDGSRLASTGGSETSITITNMATQKVTRVKLPKKFGLMTLSNVRWSTDDRWIGFTGVSLGTTSAPPVAFIARTTGKHPKAHAVAGGKTAKAA